MVTEIPAAVTEQAPPEAPEAVLEATAVEATEPSTSEPEGGAGDSTGDGALTTAVEASLEPSTLEELAQRHAWLNDKLKERDRDRENAGAQRREAQLRKEAGSKERVKRDMSVYLQAIGVDPEEAVQVGGQSIQRAEFLYTLAEARAASELAEAFPDILRTEFEIPAAAREAAIRIREESLDSDGNWDQRGYLRALIDGAAEAKAKKREAEIRAELELANSKWRADEERAMKAQATPQPAGAPVVPQGAAVNVPSVPYPQMTPEQRAAMTPAERDAAIAAYMNGQR